MLRDSLRASASDSELPPSKGGCFWISVNGTIVVSLSWHSVSVSLEVTAEFPRASSISITVGISFKNVRLDIFISCCCISISLVVTDVTLCRFTVSIILGISLKAIPIIYFFMLAVIAEIYSYSGCRILPDIIQYFEFINKEQFFVTVALKMLFIFYWSFMSSGLKTIGNFATTVIY